MKKILICDYESALEESYEITENALRESLGEKWDQYEIQIAAYQDDQQLLDLLVGTEGLITGFLELPGELLEQAKDLKYISVSAVGYGNVDCEAAREQGKTVCHIEEYCTEEVAEHTMALIGALNRNLKYYMNRIEQDHEWKYHTIAGNRTLNRQTLGIFGYGRIGKRVARLAKGYGMRILAVDPYADPEAAREEGVEIVDADLVFEQADVITNHMNLTKENVHFFSRTTFDKMRRQPVFVNVGRGKCVDEHALLEAIHEGKIRGAGLDVLEEEEPDLKKCRLLGEDRILLTPHSGFYSCDSIEALQRISAKNLGYALTGQNDRIRAIVKECR